MESQHFSFSTTVQSFRSVSTYFFACFFFFDETQQQVRFYFTLLFLSHLTSYILHVICQVGKRAFRSHCPYINSGKLTMIYISILKYYNDNNNYNNITFIHSIIVIIICCLFFDVYIFFISF